MKRLMLATTAALALAVPATAQTSAEITVEQTLTGYGYDMVTIEKLTDAQVAQLFIAITSEDETAVRTLLDGYELTQSDGPDGLYDTPRDDDTMAIVTEALMENGMAPGVANLLTDGEYTALFIAASSEDATAVNEVIAAFDFEKDVDGNMLPDSSAERRVMAALEARGLSEEQTAMIDEGETTEIFIALSSGDEAEIQNAISSALNS